MKFSALIASVLSIAVCTSAAIPVYANEQPTMGDLEIQIIKYLDTYYPEIELGTKEYIDYSMGVLIEDNDTRLKTYANYDDLKYFMGEYLYQLELYQCTGKNEESFALTDDYKMLTVEEIKEQVRAKEKLEESRESENVPVTYASFDPEAAAEYAQDHAKNYNNEYNTHIKDCTNFVSQALYAGGINMKKPSTVPTGVYDTTTYWYSIKYQDWHTNSPVSAWNESSSWINVDDLYNYCRTRGASINLFTSLSSLKNNIEVGDIVQIRNEEGNWFHSVIISDFADGEYKYCGHTSNRLNASVNNLAAEAYRCIHFS